MEKRGKQNKIRKKSSKEFHHQPSDKRIRSQFLQEKEVPIFLGYGIHQDNEKFLRGT